jgi:hypothetical protein
MNQQKNFILRWSQKQLGTAKLEENSIGALVKGIWSRTLSAIAMSALPCVLFSNGYAA